VDEPTPRPPVTANVDVPQQKTSPEATTHEWLNEVATSVAKCPESGPAVTNSGTLELVAPATPSPPKSLAPQQ
jgi:hypothetical protein